jgi:hypothetical protein
MDSERLLTGAPAHDGILYENMRGFGGVKSLFTFGKVIFKADKLWKPNCLVWALRP